MQNNPLVTLRNSIFSLSLIFLLQACVNKPPVALVVSTPTNGTQCVYTNQHKCVGARCPEGGGLCESGPGSSQPTWPDCLAHCEQTTPPAPADLPVQGRKREAGLTCSYDDESHQCEVIDCPGWPPFGESCRSSGSTQPSQKECYAHCAGGVGG